jgi:RNA polymerase subunit RPABC4/transcription elongation factor Spt4
MHLTVSRCKGCGTVFEGSFENCPHCGKLSPHGRSNLLIKWIAILIFLLAIGVTSYLLMHVPGEH